jgi:hypothetical protein
MNPVGVLINLVAAFYCGGRRIMHNKAIKYVPAAKSAASTGLPTRCFGIRLWRRWTILNN